MPPKLNETGKNENDGRSPSLAPHTEYYIKGGDLYILLTPILYRVHSHFFIRESKFWRDELTGPSSLKEEPLRKGSTSSSAIILQEDPQKFDRLLWIFYNTQFGDYSKANLKDWITIIEYATKWDFPHVKELAIRHIQTHEMDPISRIRLYQDNKLPEKYLFPLYVQVASREEVLGLEESRKLGLETLVPIHQARERLRSPVPANNRMLSPIRTDLKPTDVVEIVSATFNISFADINATPGANVDGSPPSVNGKEEPLKTDPKKPPNRR
ncbi:hypothetical protein AGABI1DRAFT_112980 [Agaricus bisporus var. burnettii JB137-S8]|uniref:BTB domain-containing protein n=1 Tax=Agaricus bisporus var. burnettii (strain JB137-S8 / ATCC MYA-4627 / FGSC 10392) TaxID=597362 RepID=K5XDR6_AGABU|nr:uncharacterized protein AGABI1DRAFT_112980 [Agaricus bisporus var. burnettii JB137-S8]EKM81312.1 hypothetical protein AGABI1DRAFT_112980 [Agaricus bisporus var. burnettii JB137-S8]